MDLGYTTKEGTISVGNIHIPLEEAMARWEEPLEEVFPSRVSCEGEEVEKFQYTKGMNIKPRGGIASPRIFIPIFPGTASEYDLIRAFETNGGEVETLIFRNSTPSAVKESIQKIAQGISQSQIVVIPESLSMGDELEGTGTFASAVFQNPKVWDGIMDLLNNRDGLMLGLGGGFDALLKLGLISEEDMALTLNSIGHHVSRMVDTRVVSNLSPWFSKAKVGDIHTTIVSEREGRLAMDNRAMLLMAKKGQIASQYANEHEDSTHFDPSMNGIEGLTSLDGRVLGRIGHPERFASNVAVNIPDKNIYNIFEGGVHYFK